MAYNPDDYEPVADRVQKFWQDHPDGSIETDVKIEDGFVLSRANVLWPGGHATGHARQELGLSGKSAEATAPLETCETSAVGRALANAGYQTKGRASREEMAKAQAAIPPVNLLYLTYNMTDDEKDAFRFGLQLKWPGIGLAGVLPEIAEEVILFAQECTAERYAEPEVVGEFSEEPF